MNGLGSGCKLGDMPPLHLSFHQAEHVFLSQVRVYAIFNNQVVIFILLFLSGICLRYTDCIRVRRLWVDTFEVLA